MFVYIWFVGGFATRDGLLNRPNAGFYFERAHVGGFVHGCGRFSKHAVQLSILLRLYT